MSAIKFHLTVTALIFVSFAIAACRPSTTPISTEEPVSPPVANAVVQEPQNLEPPEPEPQQDTTATRSLLFSCLTDNNKEILLFETDTAIYYSFGTPGVAPELDLEVPRHLVSTWQWQGIGRTESYAVEVPNGGFKYSVFWSRDRLSEPAEIEAGVQVDQDGVTLTTISCTEGIVSNLQGVKLKPTTN